MKDIKVCIQISFTFQTCANVAVQVKLEDLCLNEEQKKAVQNDYSNKSHFFKEFIENNVFDQAEALRLLQTLGLDRKSRELPERRWRAVWSTKWSLTNGESRRRILFQWCVQSFTSSNKAEFDTPFKLMRIRSPCETEHGKK